MSTPEAPNNTAADEANAGPFEPVTRHIVMEKDLNAFGNLFGGALLAWMDEASALYVMEKIGYADFVTVSLDDVDFHAPGHRGDAIVISARVLKTGSSSITLQTRAEVMDPRTGQRKEIINCKIVFVCLRDGRPYRYFESEQYKQRAH
ncbi:MAG: acyl-CoA thioesterase [Spirochaetia bacterium]|nr:acyl-CoA thioesterase [Spirochaetia bacterium]